MADIINPSTLPGFMELLPGEQISFNQIRASLENTYRLYGFLPIDTPVLEKSEVLLAKAGGETEKQIYRFQKGDTDLTMRFDLTVPLAKYVAKNYNDLTFPFKRYAIGKVYRGEKAQKGRFREFYQSDIDIIGNGSLSIVNDAEIPSIIYTALTSLGLDDFVIRINNRKVLNGLFEMFNLKDNATDVMRIIDKIDKIGAENVKAEIIDLGVTNDVADKLISLIQTDGGNDAIIAKLESFAGENETLDAGISELKEVLFYIGKFGVPADCVNVDLTIARGLDYYTGTVYETTFKKHPEIGSICSGGRYENLAGYYTKQQLPGVGMSIGLTRLFYILNEKKYINEQGRFPADVLIIPFSEDVAYAVETSVVLRNADVKTQIFFEKKKMKQMMSFADSLKIPFVMILGDDEIEKKVVSLKNMITGEQVVVPVEEAVSIIKSETDKLKALKPIAL